MKRNLALSLLALGLAAAPAHAQEPKLIDNFDDWSAFTATDGGETICYMASAPTRETGDYSKRGDAYAMVTHRPAEKSTDEVNFHAGYDFKKGSEVAVTIGGAAFKLFTDDGRAWTYDRKDDKALVSAMRRGADMTVKGTSSRGTLTTDTYSLKGFTAAHNAIDKACGVK